MPNELARTPQYVDLVGKVRPITDITLADIFYNMVRLHGDVMLELAKVNEEIVKLRSDLTVTFRDEFSKDRQELSSELGEAVLKRLAAERRARDFTVGKIDKMGF